MNRIKLWTIFCVATSIVGTGLLGATDAFASELALELRVNTQYVTDPSFDALSDENYTVGTQLAIGYDLSLAGIPGLRAYLLFDGTGQDQSRFNNALDLTWERTALMLAADYGPDLWGFFRPSARIGAGYVTQGLEVYTSGRNLTDRAHDFGALGALGFELYVPYSEAFSRATFGLTGQLGYFFQTRATFDGLTAEQDDNDPWIREPVDFGTLNTNGLFWNLGLVVRIPL
jgi:hypothetical protein